MLDLSFAAAVPALLVLAVLGDSGSGEPLPARIRGVALTDLYAHRLLAELTAIGPRPASSPEAQEAVKWALDTMEAMGLERVHSEPVTVRHWVRGPKERAVLLAGSGARADATGPAAAGPVPPAQDTELRVCALGGSIGTPAGGITAEVVEVRNWESLEKLADSARGKIVFLNRPMPPDRLDTFDAYGAAADQRAWGAMRAAKVGAVAVLVRSMTLSLTRHCHTGVMVYKDEEAPRIPAAALATLDADLLSAVLARQGTARVRLEMGCSEPGTVQTANTMGELTGSEHPEEVVVLGGHIDSWDLGPGAHDDGAGCVQALDALRILKQLGLKPRRTIRAVMFMDEEFGGAGGKAYAHDSARKNEKHVAAVESDRGGFRPLAFTVHGSDPAVERVRSWLPDLGQAGIFTVEKGYGGVDIEPLSESGTVTIGLVPESQRYFDMHHCANDTLDQVNPRELGLGAAAMAILAWKLSEEGL